MSETKRKRAPGAGRPPIDRRGSVIAQVRFTRDDWERIGRLAKKHGRDASKEIREAVHYWGRLLQKPERHIGVLICLIAILVRRIEARTGKKWIDDPVTGTYVCKLVEQLIFHFAPTPAEQVAVPPDIESIVFELITILENLLPPPGVPEVPAELFGEEWATLALIAKDLGSGWQRNRKIWMKKVEP
jgi:hypothetical protein